MLAIENDSLRSGINTLEKKDSLSHERITALKAKIHTKDELHKEEVKAKDEEIEKRGWIILGEAAAIVGLIIILF